MAIAMSAYVQQDPHTESESERERAREREREREEDGQHGGRGGGKRARVGCHGPTLEVRRHIQRFGWGLGLFGSGCLI